VQWVGCGVCVVCVYVACVLCVYSFLLHYVRIIGSSVSTSSRR